MFGFKFRGFNSNDALLPKARNLITCHVFTATRSIGSTSFVVGDGLAAGVESMLQSGTRDSVPLFGWELRIGYSAYTYDILLNISYIIHDIIYVHVCICLYFYILVFRHMYILVQFCLY